MVKGKCSNEIHSYPKYIAEPLATLYNRANYKADCQWMLCNAYIYVQSYLVGYIACGSLKWYEAPLSSL